MKYVIKNRETGSVLYLTTTEDLAQDFCNHQNTQYHTDAFYYEDYDPERDFFNV